MNLDTAMSGRCVEIQLNTASQHRCRDTTSLQRPSSGIQVFRESHHNILTSLLEGEMWFEAYLRSLSHPFECLPVALNSRKHVIYSDTPLGIACRKFTNELISIPSPPNSFTIGMPSFSDYVQHRYISQFTIIKALYYACPCQLRCNQMKVGLTPLLDAICNPSATTEVIKFLIDADLHQEERKMNYYMDYDESFRTSTRSINEMDSMAIGRRDGNNLLPLHHLICQVHRNPTILQEKSKANDVIQYLVDIYPALTNVEFDSQQRQNNFSPLIHLLSQKVICQKADQESMSRIVQCAQILLSSNSNLIKTKSVMTSCTPLHMALRNGYCNNIELIALLLKYDHDGYQVTERNKFGDLPIHIISVVGASKDTWRLILDFIHKKNNFTDPIERTSKFFSSLNKFGCTPLHLSWMRQNSGKVYYPISYPASMHRSQTRGDYFDSMQAAVDKVIATMKESPNHQININEIVSASLGQFWDTLKLILRSVYFGNHDDLKEDKADEFQYFLHALCINLGPYLPRPIFDLIFFIFKHQADEKDDFSRVPLHYACASVSFQQSELSSFASVSQSPNIRLVWFIDQLLAIKDTASITDVDGYYPLYFALKSTTNDRVNRTFDTVENCKSWCEERNLGHCVLDWPTIVKNVTKAYPDVLDLPVPNVALYPFMIAASNQMGDSLDIIYHLLKMSPTNDFISIS